MVRAGSHGPKASGRVVDEDRVRKTVRHFFPKLSDWLNGVKDPRQQKKIDYSPSEVIWAGLLMFVCKLGARRQLSFEFGTREFLLNFQRLTGQPAQGVCRSDTVGYLCKHLELREMEQLPSRLVQRLLLMRALERWHLFGPVLPDRPRWDRAPQLQVEFLGASLQSYPRSGTHSRGRQAGR